MIEKRSFLIYPITVRFSYSWWKRGGGESSLFFIIQSAHLIGYTYYEIFFLFFFFSLSVYTPTCQVMPSLSFLDWHTNYNQSHHWSPSSFTFIFFSFKNDWNYSSQLMRNRQIKQSIDFPDLAILYLVYGSGCVSYDKCESLVKDGNVSSFDPVVTTTNV